MHRKTSNSPRTHRLLGLSLVALALVILPAQPAAAQEEGCICKDEKVLIKTTFSTEDCMWAEMEFHNFLNGLCAEGFCTRSVSFNLCTFNPINRVFSVTGTAVYSCEQCYFGPFEPQFLHSGLEVVDPLAAPGVTTQATTAPLCLADEPAVGS